MNHKKFLFFISLITFSKIWSIPPAANAGIINVRNKLEALGLFDSSYGSLVKLKEKEFDTDPEIQGFLKASESSSSMPSILIPFFVTEVFTLSGQHIQKFSANRHFQLKSAELSRMDVYSATSIILSRAAALQRKEFETTLSSKRLIESTTGQNGYAGVLQYCKDPSGEMRISILAYNLVCGPRYGYLALLARNIESKLLFFKIFAGQLCGKDCSVVLPKDGFSGALRRSLIEIFSSAFKASKPVQAHKKMSSLFNQLQSSDPEELVDSLFFQNLQQKVDEGLSVAVALVSEQTTRGAKTYYLRADCEDGQTFALRLSAKLGLDDFENNWFVILPQPEGLLAPYKQACLAIGTIETCLTKNTNGFVKLGKEVISNLLESNPDCKIDCSDSELRLNEVAARQIRDMYAGTRESAISGRILGVADTESPIDYLMFEERKNPEPEQEIVKKEKRPTRYKFSWAGAENPFHPFWKSLYQGDNYEIENREGRSVVLDKKLFDKAIKGLAVQKVKLIKSSADQEPLGFCEKGLKAIVEDLRSMEGFSDLCLYTLKFEVKDGKKCVCEGLLVLHTTMGVDLLFIRPSDDLEFCLTHANVAPEMHERISAILGDRAGLDG